MSARTIDENLFSRGPVVVFRWAIAEGWPVEFVTENVSDTFGCTADDFTSGRASFVEMIHADDLERVAAEAQRHIDDGPDKFQREDYRIVKSDGEAVWLQDFTILERDEKGAVDHAIGYIVDITDRKIAEDERREAFEKLEIRVDGRTKELTREITERHEAESLLRGAIESLQEGFALFDSDDRLVVFNEAYRRLNPLADEALEKGLTFEALIRANMERGYLVDARGREEEFIRDRMEKHRNPKAPIIRKLGDGGTYILKETRTPDGGVALTFVEITELRDANAALEEAKVEAEEARALLQDALDSTMDGFAIFDADERLIVFNKSWAHLNRESKDLIDNCVTFEELLRSRALIGLVPDIGDDAEEWFRRRLDQFRNPKGPIERVYPDGSWWQVNDQRTSTGGIAQVATNITELKNREAELRDSEERFRTIFESTAVGAAIIGTDFKYRMVNDAFLQMLGFTWEELGEMSPMEITHSDDRADARRDLNALNSGELDSVLAEKRYIRKDGGELWAIVSTSAVRGPDRELLYTVRHIQDITQRKRAENSMKKLQDELTHVSRASTMGEMATGFAHELNQPLTAIANYAQGTLRRHRSGAIEDKDFVRVLELVVEQAHRAGAIIRKIRQFVQKEKPERQAFEVNSAIREAADLVQNDALRCDATIHLDLAETLPPINGDSVQLQQVVLNLARNGLEAMEGAIDGDRRLTIRTASNDSANVEIIVEDTGPGLPPAVRRSMFHPFFTTKEDGMGMGLSICRSIVEAHGGKLEFDEETLAGAAFHIVLPAAD